jgi:hypothetical protein
VQEHFGAGAGVRFRREDDVPMEVEAGGAAAAAAAGANDAGGERDGPRGLRRENAKLKRLLAERALELDFFKGASPPDPPRYPCHGIRPYRSRVDTSRVACIDFRE